VCRFGRKFLGVLEQYALRNALGMGVGAQGTRVISLCLILMEWRCVRFSRSAPLYLGECAYSITDNLIQIIGSFVSHIYRPEAPKKRNGFETQQIRVGFWVLGKFSRSYYI
jgi:hypothetical protein